MLELRHLYIFTVVISVTHAQQTNFTVSDTTPSPSAVTLTDSLVHDIYLRTTIAPKNIHRAISNSSNVTVPLPQEENVSTTDNKVASIEVTTSGAILTQFQTDMTPLLFESNSSSSTIKTTVENNQTEMPTVSMDSAMLQQNIRNADLNKQSNKSNNINILELDEDFNKTEDQKYNNSLASYDRPETCTGRQILHEQPIYTGTPVLQKCCPIGESIYYGENGKREYCDTSDKPFEPDVVDVTLYDDCIEDNEKHVELEIEAGNPCNVSFVYSKANGDALFVIQNGSLLVIDEYGNESFVIMNEYCLDVDYKTGDLFAVVCVAPIASHLERAQTILFTIFMLVSIPCLILVSFFHFAIRRLRTMHGLCLGFMSSCLAIGFLLHSIAQLSENSKSKVGYAVQYFMLSYFMWLLVLCCNIVIIVWYYLPRYVRLSRTARYMHFGTYSAFALSIPLCIVLITRSKGLGGMPSYFYQAWSESIQSSQRYFIPPVTTTLVFCFILLIIGYFGFRKLDKIVETRSIIRYTALNRSGKDNTGLPVIDLAMLEETKQDAKCITYLAIIVLTTWIMEVITFYSPGSGDYLACMEIINGLQGVFVLIFFIGVRHRRHIIVRWWKDRGSFGITEIEMQNLKQNDQDK